jgi:uncharacterized RDD family membrane protein YckC
MDSIIRISSVTGVDVELKIAGPGGRSYAFIVDWHIRFLAAAAWFLVAGVFYAGTLAFMASGQSSDPFFFFVVVAPSLAIYFLYHPILELALRGQTPGKRIAGVRLVALAHGGAPGSGSILIRNVFRLIDAMPFLYAIGLVTTIVTRYAQRIGDIAAGTVLVYDDAPRSELLDRVGGGGLQRIGLAETQLVRELLERWDGLAQRARTNLALDLLKKHGVTASPDGDDDASLRRKLEELVA